MERRVEIWGIEDGNSVQCFETLPVVPWNLLCCQGYEMPRNLGTCDTPAIHYRLPVCFFDYLFSLTVSPEPLLDMLQTIWLQGYTNFEICSGLNCTCNHFVSCLSITGCRILALGGPNQVRKPAENIINCIEYHIRLTEKRIDMWE